MHMMLTGNAHRDRGGVSRVVVRLDICVRHALVHARDDGADREGGLVRQGVGQDVSCGNLDGLFEKIVLEDNKAC